jgi:hydrogenase-4 component E
MILQSINFLAALLLLIAFAMLAQRRLYALINLFAAQGLVLSLSTFIVAYTTARHHLYFSAALTFILKVMLLPVVLRRLIQRLAIAGENKTLLSIPLTTLLGILLVIFSFNLALPVSQMAGTVLRSTFGIAVASVLLAFLMMVTRNQAISQLIAFLAMENALFFAATSVTYGMPMVVELGIALDVLVGVFIFGIFLFQLRASPEQLDLSHLEKVKEE